MSLCRYNIETDFVLGLLIGRWNLFWISKSVFPWKAVSIVSNKELGVSRQLAVRPSSWPFPQTEASTKICCRGQTVQLILPHYQSVFLHWQHICFMYFKVRLAQARLKRSLGTNALTYFHKASVLRRKKMCHNSDTILRNENTFVLNWTKKVVRGMHSNLFYHNINKEEIFFIPLT